MFGIAELTLEAVDERLGYAKAKTHTERSKPASLFRDSRRVASATTKSAVGQNICCAPTSVILRTISCDSERVIKIIRKATATANSRVLNFCTKD